MLDCAIRSALLGGLLWLAPDPAVACSASRAVIESSYPRYGAVGVPTNAVLFLSGPELHSADDVQLAAESGEIVPLQGNAAPNGLDLTPLTGLEPERKYELSVVGGGVVLEFETGSGPAAVAEPLVVPELAAVLLEYVNGTCGTTSGLCLGAAPAADISLEVRVGEEVLQPVRGASLPFFRASGGPISDDCIEVRARDVLGHRSEPRLVCGADIERVQLQLNDLSVDYSCDNYLDWRASSQDEPGGATSGPARAPGDSEGPRVVAQQTGENAAAVSDAPLAHRSDGCTLARQRPARSSSVCLGLVAAALVLARRRRACAERR